jgi:hypothetical protein
MSFEIKPSRKERKFQQVVWLDLDTYTWILELSKKYDSAPNVVIAEILRQLHERGFELQQNVQRIQTVKVEPKKVIVCPDCLGEFPDVATYKKHACPAK